MMGLARKKMGKAEGLMAPVHPGEILREDFMKPLGSSVNKLALELHVPATRIGGIVHEQRWITTETALRLARYFKTNAEFWLNLQNFYDLEQTRRSGKVSEIDRQVQPVSADISSWCRYANRANALRDGHRPTIGCAEELLDNGRVRAYLQRTLAGTPGAIHSSRLTKEDRRPYPRALRELCD